MALAAGFERENVSIRRPFPFQESPDGPNPTHHETAADALGLAVGDEGTMTAEGG